MTRDEAIEKFGNAFGSFSREVLGHYIDAFVALGMLKLDEPKSPHQRMVEACRSLDISGRMIDVFTTALENSGLRVVEK